MTCAASACETRKSTVLPEVITDTKVLRSPSRRVETDEMLLIGIISVPLLPFFTPVASVESPIVMMPAVTFAPDTPRGRSHSTRSR